MDGLDDIEAMDDIDDIEEMDDIEEIPDNLLHMLDRSNDERINSAWSLQYRSHNNIWFSVCLYLVNIIEYMVFAMEIDRRRVSNA